MTLGRKARSLEFLRRNVTSESVGVSHHLPSIQSIVPHYRDSTLNCFFVRPRAETIIRKRSPRLWIHWHTHYSLDYRLAQTGVFCNPLDYIGVEVNPFFRRDQAILDL